MQLRLTRGKSISSTRGEISRQQTIADSTIVGPSLANCHQFASLGAFICNRQFTSIAIAMPYRENQQQGRALFPY